MVGPFFFLMNNSEPQAVRRPPMPPRPPLFGIRVHPVVGFLVALAIVGAVVLILCATNSNFMPQFNPFATMLDPH